MKGTIWCLHGAVGMADDWRAFSVPGWAVKRVDLWRFLDCCPMGLEAFGKALNEEARSGNRGAGSGSRNVLLGYSMGGRLALHALLTGGPWSAAVVVSAHPGLEEEADRAARRETDAEWASRALSGDWAAFLGAWNAQSVLSGGVEGLADRSRLETRRRSVARSFMDWSLGHQEALAGRIAEIRCPLFWVAGERDGKFRSLMEQVVRRVAGPGHPRIESWVAPGAGHRVPWDSGDFAGKVGEFLERTVS